jgi:hypothetical protein
MFSFLNTCVSLDLRRNGLRHLGRMSAHMASTLSFVITRYGFPTRRGGRDERLPTTPDGEQNNDRGPTPCSPASATCLGEK